MRGGVRTAAVGVRGGVPIRRVFVIASGVISFTLACVRAGAGPVSYVIHVSMDGLRPDAITFLGPTNLPNFYRLRGEGAFTDNARTDYDFTVTLPNHVCQLTGRGVSGPTGQGWTANDEPGTNTLASEKGSYVAGVFDVVHDNGLRTALFASKSKFSLFQTSWDGTNGAPDLIGPDDGQNKLDFYLYLPDTAALVDALVASMASEPFHYAFLHLRDPDTVGHSYGWIVSEGSDYCEVIKTMDARLGEIFNLIDNDAQLIRRTAIILTADHGGAGGDHSDPALAEDYTIPFYVWGPGTMPATDLYRLNPTNRLNPGTDRPAYSEPVQPIRNGEAANLALRLLGLGPVPGSTIGAAQDLRLAVPPPTDLALTLEGGNLVASFTLVPGVFHDVQCAGQPAGGAWTNIVSDIAGAGGARTNVILGPANQPQGYYRLQLHFRSWRTLTSSTATTWLALRDFY
jgi:hypothetical protein